MNPRLVSLFVLLVAAAFGRADGPWTTLKGRIVLEGEIPAIPEIKVSADVRHCLSHGKLYDDVWVVNKANRGVKNVYVWLASDPKTASGKNLPVHDSLKATPPAVVIDQPQCQFTPRVVALREGQLLVVKNSSPVTHNVRWEGANNPGGNETVPAGQSVRLANLKAERLPLRVSCSVHPWMIGRVAVFDHPYFAVTDGDGKFEIPLAPVGKYRLFVYHEGCGWRNGAKGRNGEEIELRPGPAHDTGPLTIAAHKN